MLRTGAQYRDSIRDGRRIWIDGQRVQDVTTHPVFKPIVDIRSRIYDMQHEAGLRDIMVSKDASGEDVPTGLALPLTKEDLRAKRRAVNAVLDDVGGVVSRVGDETIGEMWSLHDGKEVLKGIDANFADNIDRHIARILKTDTFHVSANTDPKGDRSKLLQDQDPDMLLRVVKETDAGIIVRGAKFETAAAYANQAFVKPTIANWGSDKLSNYAVGFISDFSSPNMRFICRSGFAGRGSVEDYPLSNRFDEVDTLVIYDDVLVPWENVLFNQHTQAAAFIRSTLHRYAAFPFLQRLERFADMMIGVALLNVTQTGLDRQPAVQEKLCQLAGYRETINAHLTASIETAGTSPGGLCMYNQSLIYTGRTYGCGQLHHMMHIARELCGGQICVTPAAASFQDPEAGAWLEKYYSVNDNWKAEDRRRLLAFARDLLNSDYAGHRLTFHLFAQSPPYAQAGAIYRNFDWAHSRSIVEKAAHLSPVVHASS